MRVDISEYDENTENTLISRESVEITTKIGTWEVYEGPKGELMVRLVAAEDQNRMVLARSLGTVVELSQYPQPRSV